MTELLPCPCGYAEIVPQHMALEICQDMKSPRWNKKQSRIWCPGCGLTMIKDGPSEVIAAWNTRPAAGAGAGKTMRAALQRQVDNVEHWLATGEAASPEESKSIYEQMKAALAEAGQ